MQKDPRNGRQGNCWKNGQKTDHIKPHRGVQPVPFQLLRSIYYIDINNTYYMYFFTTLSLSLKLSINSSRRERK